MRVCMSVLTEDHLQKSLFEVCPSVVVTKSLIREHTKRDPPLLLCTGSRCHNTVDHDLHHGVIHSGNNDTPVVVGVDDNSIKTTSVSEECTHGVVVSDLVHTMVCLPCFLRCTPDRLLHGHGRESDFDVVDDHSQCEHHTVSW